MPFLSELLIPPSGIVLAALVGLLFPIYLVATRFLPSPFDSATRRYFTACVLSFLSWFALALLIHREPYSGVWLIDLVNGGLVLGTIFIIYLEIWGLLTRGCSISILLALSRLKRISIESELAAAYSDGRGLRWLTTKRLNSLLKAGFVEQSGGIVRVTTPWGFLAARSQAILVRIIGLRSYG